MLWWGKAFAGGLAALIGGPLAGLAALGVGHQMDRDLSGLRRAYAPPADARARERLLRTRRTALFSLAGALARTADLPATRRAALLEGLSAEQGRLTWGADTQAGGLLAYDAARDERLNHAYGLHPDVLPDASARGRCSATASAWIFRSPRC